MAPDLGVNENSIAAKRLSETLCRRLASRMQEVMSPPAETGGANED